MRRALHELRAWPALSRVYGLMPWDVERLTPDEVTAYLEDLKQLYAD